MIVDIHRHPVAQEWFSESHWRGFARMILQGMARMGIPGTVESVMSDFFPLHYDIDGQKHLAHMQDAGIDKTTMFLFDTGMLTGEPEVPIENQNLAVFEMARRYPDHIIPFVHMDPRRPGAVDFVKKSVEEYGAKGLKLHPGAGFNPEGAETLNLIEAVAGYGIPVITHTGASIPPTSSKYCDPIYLDEILLRFPEVNVIAAHLGHGHKDQLNALGWMRPNLYTEVSAWQGVAASNYPKFARAVKEAVESFGPDKVMFGTDSPYLWTFMPEKDYVEAVRKLATEAAPKDARLTDHEVDMILGQNARTLLKLS